jgi:ligand-binding SRPBCC domain-containing protein
MARFKHTFRVNAPLSAVWQLHDDPKALYELTPPPVKVTIVELDQPLRAGSHLKFRLSIGPLGANWHAIYDEFEPYQPGWKQCGFVDRSISSPFQSWTHHHVFDELTDGTSTVMDDASFELVGGALGNVITWIVAWPAIAFLFMFRRTKTRQMLARMLQTSE